MNLRDTTTGALVDELSRRNVLPRCSCKRWATYLGRWDADGYTLRCHGCLKAVGKCRCS